MDQIEPKLQSGGINKNSQINRTQVWTIDNIARSKSRKQYLKKMWKQIENKRFENEHKFYLKPKSQQPNVNI